MTSSRAMRATTGWTAGRRDTMAGRGWAMTPMWSNVATDKVTELAGQGNDTIETSLATFSLAALTAVENLTYTGTGNFDGYGQCPCQHHYAAASAMTS